MTVSTEQAAKAISVSLKAIAYREIRQHLENAMRPYIEEWIKETFKGAGIVRYDSYQDPMSGNNKMRFIVEMETNEDPFAGH